MYMPYLSVCVWVGWVWVRACMHVRSGGLHLLPHTAYGRVTAHYTRSGHSALNTHLAGFTTTGAHDSDCLGRSPQEGFCSAPSAVILLASVYSSVWIPCSHTVHIA